MLTAGYARKSTALEISIFIGRFDIAKLVISAGLDPICGGNPAMRPIFIEYVHYHAFVKLLAFIFTQRLNPECHLHYIIIQTHKY